MKLKNVWGDMLTLFKPVGHPESVSVEPGQVVEIPGELADDQPHDDAIVVKHPDGELMAYPTALWGHVDAAPDKEVSGSTESDAAQSESIPPEAALTQPAETVVSPSVAADLRTARSEG